ncbi:immunoglobulin domain-containing protein, partial [Marinifilum sp. D737]|uniref:immunoglobulin domain-containing protein n=1 Tax=Marinifilum sp. D737 TaxID=2969628 RepID=UPI0022753EA4
KYKWYKDDVEVVGATNSTYNFGNITLTDEAEYKCEIYNDQHCNDIIRIFNVDVLEPATVNDPLAVVMCETDANPVFTVVAGGDDTPLTYQWYNTGGAITGATNSSYTETTPVDGESYYCEVKNTCATVQSKRASLTVVKILGTTNPLDLTIADGADATFKVTASGEPNYSYQWEENKGSGWNPIIDGIKYSGATTSELKITNALKADFDGNQYRCVVSTDGNGTVVCITNVTSSAATLTINTVVKVAVQASDAEVCFGKDAKLSVEGTSDALTFTWEYNNGSGTWSNADGVLGMSAVKAGAVSTLTVPCNDMNINNWTFRCLVSDGLSTNEYSRDTKIRVLEDIAVTAGTLNHVLCENDALTMSVTATAGDDIQYRWYKDIAPGTILSTNSTYGIGNVVLADEGNYTCEIYNVQGCNDQTVNFTVDVREHVTVSDPVNVIMCESDADPVFTVTASGDGPFDYQWYNSAGAITGAINASYTETAPVDGESYYCEVKNFCGTVQSKVASLTV